MRLRAAVIGCGRIGFKFDADPKRKYIATHTGAYSRIPDVELVAISDLNIPRLKECKERWGIPYAYRDFKKMLREQRIDILSIATPPATHYPILKEAVKFPLKAIFCEKPIAGSLKEAKKIVELSRKKRIILQIDHQRRFDPLHINLRKLIKEKKFGGIQQVNFYYTAGIKNTGSHMFDLLRFLFGEVEWIEAFYSKNLSFSESDPNLDGILRFRDGVFATFQACSKKQYLIFELNCFLEKGRFVLKDSGFGIDFYGVEESRHFSGYRELSKIPSLIKAGYRRNFMLNAVRHLIECIRRGKESISSGGDGYKALQLVKSALNSANKDGKRIFLR